MSTVISASQDATKNPFTITRYILQEQKKYPKAKGDLTIILNSVVLAVKIISAAAKGAGIFQRYGMKRLKNDTSVSSLPNLNKKRPSLFEDQIDVDALKNNASDKKSEDTEDANEEDEEEDIRSFAYDSILSSVSWCNKISMILSTQNAAKPINISPCKDPKYVLVFDPIDGRQNIKINASIGTIFGIYRIADPSNVSSVDLLQSGNEMVCAGYALYGDATVLMLSFGDEVNGFTLDPSIGEFIMTHKNVQCPKEGQVYSVNEGYADQWDDAVKKYVANCKAKAKKSRYIGCMVADIHRCLIRGGIFMYPATKKYPNGKLNLQCECNPIAFIVKAAGGKASNGTKGILEVKPEKTDQTMPVFMGSEDDVNALEALYKKL